MYLPLEQVGIQLFPVDLVISQKNMVSSEFVVLELIVRSGERKKIIAKNLRKFDLLNFIYLTLHVDHNQVFGYLHRGWCHQYKNDIEHSCNLQEPKRPLKNKRRIILYIFIT